MNGKYCLLIFTVFHDAISVMIDIPPSNVTVFEGDDVTLQCQTFSQQPGELVVWKKVSDFSGRILSINNRSTDSRFHVQGIYNLVIRDVTVDDDGMYLCDAEKNMATAYISVSVPMEELTLTSDVLMPLPIDRDVNLTCRSRHSHPPADIRWFKGQSELTSAKTSTTKIYKSDGFGDCESIITVRMRGAERDIPFRCIADLPAKAAIKEAFFFPSVTNDCTYRRLGTPLLYTVLVIISLCNIVVNK